MPFLSQLKPWGGGGGPITLEGRGEREGFSVAGMESALRGDAGLGQGSFHRTGRQEPRREGTGPGSVAGALQGVALDKEDFFFFSIKTAKGWFYAFAGDRFLGSWPSPHPSLSLGQVTPRPFKVSDHRAQCRGGQTVAVGPGMRVPHWGPPQAQRHHLPRSSGLGPDRTWGRG